MTWWQALIDAGALPVAFVPNPAAARGSKDETEPADRAAFVEGAELEAHPVPDRGGARIPPAVSFLAGFARWGVVACDGIIQVVDAYVAAAVRRRDGRGVLHTTFERNRAFAVAPLERMTPGLRQALEASVSDVEPIDGELAGQPARYLRLWPWEGNDLLYGLLRVEARPDPASVALASELSGWLVAERAPLATPATRWDRLLYPLHNVEEYLKARAPRDLSKTRHRLPVAS